MLFSVGQSQGLKRTGSISISISTSKRVLYQAIRNPEIYQHFSIKTNLKSSILKESEFSSLCYSIEYCFNSVLTLTLVLTFSLVASSPRSILSSWCCSSSNTGYYSFLSWGLFFSGCALPDQFYHTSFTFHQPWTFSRWHIFQFSATSDIPSFVSSLLSISLHGHNLL